MLQTNFVPVTFTSASHLASTRVQLLRLMELASAVAIIVIPLSITGIHPYS